MGELGAQQANGRGITGTGRDGATRAKQEDEDMQESSRKTHRARVERNRFMILRTDEFAAPWEEAGS